MFVEVDVYIDSRGLVLVDSVGEM